MSPPSSIDGKKIACDRSTVVLASAETTPINVPNPANRVDASAVARTSAVQFVGTGASKSGPAVSAMIIAATIPCSTTPTAGAPITATAGTPFTLYER